MSTNEFYYLPQNEAPSPWNIDIHGTGTSEILSNQTYPPPGHPEEYRFNYETGRKLSTFQVLYITRGSGDFESELTPTRQIEAPFLFLLFPHIWHRYRPHPDSGWHEHWIDFDGPAARQLLESGTLDPRKPFFEVGHHDGILSQFQMILDEARDEAHGFRRIAAASVLQILALSTSLPLRRTEESNPMRATVRRACFLMRKRVDEAISIEDLSAELNVGYTYFRRMFKQYTGFSPKQYHTQLRYERVKRLLEETNLTVSRIADLLAFDSSFHLSDWFKQRSGLSPLNWRKKITQPPLTK